MARFLNEWLRLARLHIDPNFQNASKYFKHWLKTFTDFLERIVATPRHKEFAAPNTLEVSCAYVSCEVGYTS